MPTLSVRTVILQALIRGEAYGLEVADRVATMTKGETKLGPGRLYPTLRALEEEGLLRSRIGEPEPERGGRPRVYYSLTAKGSKAALADRAIGASVFGFLAGKVS